MPIDPQPAKTQSPAITALKNELANLTWPREGLLVDATLINKGPRIAYFDLGKFGTGVVYGAEFLNAKEIVRELVLGDIINAKIVALDGEGGHTELSLTEASRQKVWQQVQDLQESGDIIKVKVTGINQGGLMANVFELKGFLPFSQLSPEHYPKDMETDRARAMDEMKNFVGQELSVKVINVNAKKNKLILSERETVSVNIKELLSNYTKDQVVDGMVSGIADFGIFVRFVDNPQIEGLVHISEIDHRIIDNPKETVQMNEAVKVKIIDIRDGRVFLSLKALKPDPWATIGELYKEGAEVTGRVHKYNPFGAVINLDGGVQGLIHVSEFGGLDEMKKIILPGESYPFVIASLKPEEKRLILKVKR
jgi:small subunit ribosomal protein S1